MVFYGECGYHYSFYSVAVDNVGNVEQNPATPMTTEILAIMGDTDGSGEVDLADIILTLQIMNKTDEQDMLANICADVNEDGRIDLVEAIYVLQHVAGLR